MLTPLHALVLGIVQGLTEFLPVSSTAHLVLIPWVLRWSDPGQTFDVALHLGTLIALVAYFWKDWVDLLTRNHRMLGLILIACIPAGIAGALLEKRIELYVDPDKYPLAPLVMAFFLAAAGLLLYWADHRGRKRRDIERLDTQDALMIGIGQMFALCPGVSRSGATISAGMLLGLTREAAARFSFLVSAPIILGAVGLKAFHVLRHPSTVGDPAAWVVGVAAAAVSGYLAIKFLMNWVRTKPYDGFVIYRIAAAVAIIAFWFMHR